MLESKLALNNLNFKCYIQGFLSDRSFGRKILWALSAPSQSFMFGQECRHLKVNHVVNKMQSHKGSKGPSLGPRSDRLAKRGLLKCHKGCPRGYQELCFGCKLATSPFKGLYFTHILFKVQVKSDNQNKYSRFLCENIN